MSKMKSCPILPFLLLISLFSNAADKTKPISSAQLDGQYNPTYSLSPLKVGDDALTLNELAQELNVTASLNGILAGSNSSLPLSAPFPSYNIPPATSRGRGTYARLATVVGSAHITTYLGRHAGSTDRFTMHMLLELLTCAGVIAHFFDQQEITLLLSSVATIGFTGAVIYKDYNALNAAINYFAYSAFIANFYVFANDIIYDHQASKYIITTQSQYDHLKEADFDGDSIVIWQYFGSLVQAAYRKIFNHFLFQFHNGNKCYSDHMDGGQGDLMNAVIPDYEIFRDQYQEQAEDFDFETVGLATTGLGLLSYPFKNLYKYPFFAVAVATTTQEVLNIGLDCYCGGYWEEKCLGFWRYNAGKELFSSANMKYIIKSAGSRHLLPSMALVFFLWRAKPD